MSAFSETTDTRNVILDAVERLLGRYGYQRMTMDDIAREAGVGRRTIYLHFSGKEEVALSSIDRVVERVLNALREIATNADLTAPERIRQMLVMRILARLTAVRDYHESLDSLFEALRPAYMKRRTRYFESEASLFVQILEEGRRDGSLTPHEDPCSTAHLLLVATNALLPYSLSVRELGEIDAIADRTRRIADLLLTGLQSR